MTNKIGVGILTCGREDLFKKCVSNLSGIDKLVIVNDNTQYPQSVYPNDAEVFVNKKPTKIAISKNKILRTLIRSGCDHLFVIEDDVMVSNPEVFMQYIKTAEKSGLWHLNYGYHGNANKKENGEPAPRQVIEYGDGFEVALNKHLNGGFSYYLKSIIKHVGYFDERFDNCFEHTDHMYRIIEKGLSSPYWWFPDIVSSNEYILDLDPTLERSLLKHEEERKGQLRQGMEWFKTKHGFYPVHIPDVPQGVVITKMEKIQDTYSRKVL